MSQNIMVPETLEHALAQTQQQDERDDAYWHDRINERGWTVHLGDEHSIGRYLPYAMVVIEVQHIQGDDYFCSARDHPRTALGYPVIVFADELGTDNRATRNRQSDGNTYIYNLSGLDPYVRGGEQGYAALPTGLYRLEVMVPLFKTEAVVLKRDHRTGYRVSTAQGFFYDSNELEEDLGFMGLCQAVTSFAPRGFVWKLVTTPSSIEEFEVEMANRALVFWGAVHDQEAERMEAVRAWREAVAAADEDFQEDVAMMKVEDVKVEDVKEEDIKAEDVKLEEVKLEDVKLEDVKVEDFKAEDIEVEDVKEGIARLAVEDSEDENITGDSSDWTSESDGYIVVSTESDSDNDNDAGLNHNPVAPWRALSKKLKRSRHDPDELWVQRGGKRMKF